MKYPKNIHQKNYYKDLKMSDCFAESLPLHYIISGFLKHELTARYGHVSNQQTLLEKGKGCLTSN